MLQEWAENPKNKRNTLRDGAGSRRKTVQPESDISYYPTATPVRVRLLMEITPLWEHCMMQNLHRDISPCMMYISPVMENLK